MNGYLLVDKPTGWTSHDVVAQLRHVLRQSSSDQSLVTSRQRSKTSDYELTTRATKLRVGHTGTLDPLATGLMILVIGSYTKRAGEFSKLDKTYDVELTLGATSATGDAEGPIIVVPTEDYYKKMLSHKKVTEILNSFVGEIEQTPHAHSAVKVGGQRAYKLARAGKTPELKPRKVLIYEIRNMKYEYPRIWFTTHVSSGTYIRSLAENIGQKLGTGAYVSALRRTKVGKFKLDDAVRTESLSVEKIAEKLKKI